MRTWFRAVWVVLGVLMLGACTPSTEPSSSAAPSSDGSAPAAGNLPPGCEQIDLLGPDGERVVLDGYWLEEAEGAPMTWSIKTEGNCVWGVGMILSVPYNEAVTSAHTQSLRGQMGTDFVIDGEIVLMGPEVNFERPPIYSPVRFLIEVDGNGEITLREDREHGMPGPRCVDPTYACIRPLVLRPGDETD